MVRAHLRFAAALVATNWKACLALRGAFLLQIAAMALNNLLFFAMWWVFFERFDEVRGWRLSDMLSLYGVVASGFGLCVILAGGIRDLARSIADGELDALLVQPKSVLLSAVGSRSLASGWGDLASGLILIGLSGLLEPSALPRISVAIALSALMFAATGVLLHSAAFWFGQVEALARMAWEFMLTFSLYPPVLFRGALRLMLFSLVPAGFVGYLPVEIVRDFSWSDLALALAGTGVYTVLAASVFGRGLRAYESGSRFGVRG